MLLSNIHIICHFWLWKPTKLLAIVTCCLGQICWLYLPYVLCTFFLEGIPLWTLEAIPESLCHYFEIYNSQGTSVKSFTASNNLASIIHEFASILCVTSVSCNSLDLFLTNHPKYHTTLQYMFSGKPRPSPHFISCLRLWENYRK